MTIRAMIRDVDPNAKELQRFRAEWSAATVRENAYLTKNSQAKRLSQAQSFTIDLWCGVVQWENSSPIYSILSGQVEFEALVRGRQIALAAAFHRC